MASQSNSKGKGTENVSTDESLLNQDSSVASPPPSILYCPKCKRQIVDVCRDCLASLIGIKRAPSPLPSPTPMESSSCSAPSPSPFIQICPFCNHEFDVVCTDCLSSLMRIRRLPSSIPMESSSCSAPPPSIQHCPFCKLKIVDVCRDCLAILIGIKRSPSHLPSPTPMESGSCSAPSPPHPTQHCPFCKREIDVVCIDCLAYLMRIKCTPSPTPKELSSSSSPPPSPPELGSGSAPPPPSVSFVMLCSICVDVVNDFCRCCPGSFVARSGINCSECHRAINTFCVDCERYLVVAGDTERDRNQPFPTSLKPGAYNIIANQCHGVRCTICGHQMHNHCVMKRLFGNNRTCPMCGADLTN